MSSVYNCFEPIHSSLSPILTVNFSGPAAAPRVARRRLLSRRRGCGGSAFAVPHPPMHPPISYKPASRPAHTSSAAGFSTARPSSIATGSGAARAAQSPRIAQPPVLAPVGLMLSGFSEGALTDPTPKGQVGRAATQATTANNQCLAFVSTAPVTTRTSLIRACNVLDGVVTQPVICHAQNLSTDTQDWQSGSLRAGTSNELKNNAADILAVYSATTEISPLSKKKSLLVEIPRTPLAAGGAALAAATSESQPLSGGLVSPAPPVGSSTAVSSWDYSPWDEQEASPLSGSVEVSTRELSTQQPRREALAATSRMPRPPQSALGTPHEEVTPQLLSSCRLQ